MFFSLLVEVVEKGNVLSVPFTLHPRVTTAMTMDDLLSALPAPRSGAFVLVALYSRALHPGLSRVTLCLFVSSHPTRYAGVSGL